MPPKRERVVAPAPAPVDDVANQAHNDRVQKAIANITACAFMRDILTAPPIGRGAVCPSTGKSGYKDIFNAETVRRDLSATGMSEMAGNFFWQNSLQVPLAGVPLNSRSIQLLVDRNFAEPCPFPMNMVVAFPSADYESNGHKGSWVHVTVEEFIHAYILAVERDIDNRAKQKLWRFHLLTVTFSFTVLSGEDVYWKQARMRQDAEVQFQVVTRSALQRIYEVNMVLGRRVGQRALSNAQLAAMYQQHLQQVESQEQITTNYISEAVRLYKGLLSNKKVAELLARMDEEWGKDNPLNSVTKLSNLLSKTKTPETAAWFLEVLHDRIRAKQSTLHDGWSVDVLTGLPSIE